MKTLLALVLIALGVSPANAQTKPAALPDGVTAKEVKFFSEAVQCYAKIFTPKGFTADGKAPAIVLAPTPGETAASIDKYAAQMAGRGLVAMTIDYRGWGRSGGFLYLAEPLRWDDRLRFSQHTATVRIRRKRVIPDAQVQDIRNAISYLQGEPGLPAHRACAARPAPWRFQSPYPWGSTRAPAAPCAGRQTPA